MPSWSRARSHGAPGAPGTPTSVRAEGWRAPATHWRAAPLRAAWTSSRRAGTRSRARPWSSEPSHHRVHWFTLPSLSSSSPLLFLSFSLLIAYCLAGTISYIITMPCTSCVASCRHFLVLMSLHLRRGRHECQSSVRPFWSHGARPCLSASGLWPCPILSHRGRRRFSSSGGYMVRVWFNSLYVWWFEYRSI
jgi:hypothetical protein